MATVNWMIDEIPDAETDLGVGMLEHILNWNPSFTPRKALVTPGWARTLPDAVSTTRFCSRCFRSVSRASIRAAPKRSKSLILETLRALVDEGVDRMTVEAS